MKTRSSTRTAGGEEEPKAQNEYLEVLKKRVEEARQRERDRGVFIRMRDFVDDILFKYNITSGLYMLDPWERVVFNLVALLVLLLVVFSGYRQVVFVLNFLS
ncbi:hypothetical protein HKI87_05g37460 [Chloropicon roscoffensis]|uniref:Uncharacterized protein n=1 Tax=Chloropicon roscoffensis TaxID=1461544 RepID=A0AAX4P9G1_9CHLO